MTVPMLQTKIMLVAGWHNDALSARRFAAESEDAWTGTIEQFWENNPEMTYGEMKEVADDAAFGVAHIGGGAAPCFTIIRA